MTLDTKFTLKEVLRTNWKGLYYVDKPVGAGAYKLLNMNRNIGKHLGVQVTTSGSSYHYLTISYSL